MDLLGRKAQRQLAATTANLREALYIAQNQGAALSELSSRISSRESLISDLLAETEILEADNRRLIARAAYLDGMLQAVPTVPKREEYRVSEEEQEAEWQLKQGIIDAQEYEHLLKELDFQNANIELDPDYTPRPELTY